MTTELWASLNADQQKVLNDAYETAYDFQMKAIEAEEADQLKKMIDYGCVVTELTADEKAAWMASAEPVNAAYRESLGADVYGAFTAAVAEAAAKVG